MERAYGRTVEMGIDYAMTEVVHCKSESEIGVNRCKTLCAETWMDRIITLSSAKVLMLFGSIAKEWFGPKVALLASLMASIYPYYVWHDTSLQDTCLFVFLTTLSVLIISRSYSNLSISSAAWAGIILGVATLTKVTLIPLVIIYCISVMFLSNSTIRSRLLH